MIFKWLRLLNKNQKGFTLIELLVVIAITALITGGIVLTIFQVFNVNTLSSNHMIAAKQVENAGHWISRDTLMAPTPDTDDDTETAETEVLTLAWVGWERVDHWGNQYIDSYEVRYTYDSDELWRHQRITTEERDKNGQLADPQPDPQNSTTFIADHITSISIPAMADNKLNVTITASVGDAVEERTYEIMPRPST